MPNFEFHGPDQSEGALDLQPYEIRAVSDKFIAKLPIAGTKSADGKIVVTTYGEQSFETLEDAHRTVADARKDLGLPAWN